MKQSLFAIVSVSLMIVAVIALHERQIDSPVAAQEVDKLTKEPRSAKRDGASSRRASDVTTDRPYPVWFLDEVVSRLTAAAEALIEQKQARNSEDLRKDLERTSFSMTLARPATKELSPQDLYHRATDSVFLIAGLTKPSESDPTWKTAFSTGFAVHEDGILSTSAHVFDHDDRDHAVVVMDSQNRVFPITELLAVDRHADTCLFRTTAKGLKPLPLAKDLLPGTPIRVMGHPGDSFFFFSAGLIANYERDEENHFWMNVTADFGQGSSGGPVMDTSGNVVGQVSRTYTLYASGESSGRPRRRRIQAVRQTSDTDLKKENTPADNSESKKEADTQMVFKACTPVSAIRALVK